MLKGNQTTLEAVDINYYVIIPLGPYPIPGLTRASRCLLHHRLRLYKARTAPGAVDFEER